MSATLPAAGGRLEFQRQNFRVGLLVIVATIVFVAMGIIAVQKRLFLREYRLTTSFGRIEGLDVGSEVFLRGYAVGRVTKIDFVSIPDVRFDVEFTVEEAVRLPAGTRVRLSTRGFASKVLDLVTPGDPTDPEAPPPPPGDRPVVELRPGDRLPGAPGSDLDALLSDVLVLTRRVSGTLQRLDTLVVDQMGPQIERTMTTVTKDLDSLTADLNATMKEARSVLRQTDSVITEMRPKANRLIDLAGDDLKLAGDLGRKADAILSTFETRITPLVDDLASSLTQTNTLLGRADRTFDEEEIKTILANVKTLSEQGNALVAEFQRRPWRLFRRVKGEKQDLVDEIKARRKAEAASGPP